MKRLGILKTLTVLSLLAVIAQSCIKPAHEEEFGPLEAKSCTDGILNQGEYFTDCGGPCAECAYDSYVSFMLSSKPWNNPDTTDISVKSAKDSIVVVDSTRLRIFMADGATPPNTLTFVIDRTWRGVQELTATELAGSLFHSATGQVNIESGVVSITNVDEVNGYITGEFKFNFAPNSNGNRWSAFQGVFKDQAMFPM